MDTFTSDMSVADMQRKMDRMRFSASNLQTAHNRTLKRLKAAATERDELRQMIEAGAGVMMYLYYENWCRSHGIKTPREKEMAKVYAIAQRVPRAL